MLDGGARHALGEALLKRLALNEYIPWVGHAASWALILLLIGHEQGVVLATSALLLTGVRALTRLHFGALFAFWPKHRRLVLQIAASSLVAAALLTALLVGLLLMAGRHSIAAALGLISAGLPARYLLAAAGPRHRGVARYRIAQAWLGAALLLAIAATGPGGDWRWTALVLIVREWLALVVVSSAPMRRDAQVAASTMADGVANASAEPLAALVDANRLRARARLGLQATRLLTHALLGPFSGVLTRTVRGLRLHRRPERWALPSGLVAGAASVLCAAGLVLLLIDSAPWLNLLGASLLRAAAAGASAAAWAQMRAAR